MTDAITAALLRARARKAVLPGLLHPPQPRDSLGRFTTTSILDTNAPACGFDGGARTPAPAPPDPVRDHDLLVGELVAWSRTFRSGGF